MITLTIERQKTSLILFAILFFFYLILNAQKISKENKINEIWVKPMNKSAVIKGYLYSVNATSISLMDNKSMDKTNLITINVKNIDVIKWRRKGNIKKGLSYGAAGGALIGIIVGFTADLGIESEGGGDDLLILAEGISRGALTIGTTFTYGVIGGGIGTLISSKKKKAFIKGNVENYTKELAKLKEICIK